MTDQGDREDDGPATDGRDPRGAAVRGDASPDEGAAEEGSPGTGIPGEPPRLHRLRARIGADPGAVVPEPDEAASTGQGEFPFALVAGEPVTELPQDLYIPPEALEVFLEAFEGPLDLLLYLIRRQNLDILEISVAAVTEQYMGYIALMDALHLELAAEYLVMAALLAEIKSRMLLPRSEDAEEDEGDPRAELVRRLQEYEVYREAAADLDGLPRMERDVFSAGADVPELDFPRPEPTVEMRDLMLALAAVLRRAELNKQHAVQMEQLSTRQRMSEVLERLQTSPRFVEFTSCFAPEEGRLGVAVTLFAIMELERENLIEIVQTEAFAPIHVRLRERAAEG